MLRPVRGSGPCLATLVVLLAVPALAGPRVTVYSSDLGFVRESRTLEIAGARDTVRIEDVPERIDFPSVRLAPADGTKVTRLAYRYDVASGDELLERGKGTRVRVTERGDRTIEGTLVAADGSWLMVRGDDGSVSAVSRAAVEDVRLVSPLSKPALRPALEAVIEGGRRGKLEAELSYLTGGLSWSAEHTLIRSGESGGVWSTAVTIENNTGRTFRDASLKLVAGEPRRVTPMPPPVPLGRMQVQTDMAQEKVAAFAEQSFSEYHLYTLEHPATLRDQERQSLPMVDARSVKLSPRYLYRVGAPAVAAQVEMVNSNALGPGVPLPAGRVRFYEKDPSGDLQFTGETTIGHTPEGEKLTLEMGNVFDLAAEQREIYNKRISDREREVSVEVKLRNRKKSEVTIVVEAPVSGDNEVIQKSHPFTRKDSNTLVFNVPVPAGKEAVLTYVVRQRF